MPHERRPPDDPREWLNRARSNLVRARTMLPGVYLEDLCFDAQQAAEKAFKAVLIARGVDFPLVHDLARLLTLLGQSGETIPQAIADATDLTRFAVTTRYPSVAEPFTAEEHHRAVAIAEAVVAWANVRVGEGSPLTRENTMRMFADDDAGYLAWIDGHQHGFVVNTTRKPDPRYLILHQASCGTIGGKPTVRRNWTTGDYLKVCAETRGELEQWARQVAGGELHPCGLCKPD